MGNTIIVPLFKYCGFLFSLLFFLAGDDSNSVYSLYPAISILLTIPQNLFKCYGKLHFLVTLYQTTMGGSGLRV